MLVEFLGVRSEALLATRLGDDGKEPAVPMAQLLRCEGCDDKADLTRIRELFCPDGWGDGHSMRARWQMLDEVRK